MTVQLLDSSSRRHADSGFQAIKAVVLVSLAFDSEVRSSCLQLLWCWSITVIKLVLQERLTPRHLIPLAQLTLDYSIAFVNAAMIVLMPGVISYQPIGAFEGHYVSVFYKVLQVWKQRDFIPGARSCSFQGFQNRNQLVGPSIWSGRLWDENKPKEVLSVEWKSEVICEQTRQLMSCYFH